MTNSNRSRVNVRTILSIERMKNMVGMKAKVTGGIDKTGPNEVETGITNENNGSDTGAGRDIKVYWMGRGETERGA